MTEVIAELNLVKERRMSHTEAETMALLGENQGRLAKSYDEGLAQLRKEIEEQRDLAAQRHEELTDRLDKHSDDLINHELCLTRAVGAFEERMRKEQASRLTSEHRAILRQKEFLDGLAQWSAATATIQTAVSGLQEATATMQGSIAAQSVRHEVDKDALKAALSQHAKRESALTRAGVMSPVVFGIILTAVWYLFGPTIRKVIDAAVKLAIGP